MDYWIERSQAVISRSLASLEKQHAAIDQGFTLGAISVAVALGYLDLRFPEFNWRDNQPKLGAWFADISTRKSMQATEPPAS